MINHRLSAELNFALERRRDENNPLHVFFRDDDVDEDEPSLARLLNLFLSRGVSINLGVIPGRITDKAVTALARRRGTASGDAITLNQHGWEHTNHERSGRKCEFGASRTFSEQLEDIARGRSKMSEAFGDDLYPAFIPPWNRCSGATYRALDDQGFSVLSKKLGDSLITGYKFREYSITLDLYRWRGGAQLKHPEETVRELISQIERMNTIGVMLHHKVMSDGAFLFLDVLIESLRKHSIVRFHTFKTLAGVDGV